MASKLKDAMPNPAQIRGDIQRGLTGDKRPGFDPAMAPLETDSEAGGVPLPMSRSAPLCRRRRKRDHTTEPAISTWQWGRRIQGPTKRDPVCRRFFRLSSCWWLSLQL